MNQKEISSGTYLVLSVLILGLIFIYPGTATGARKESSLSKVEEDNSNSKETHMGSPFSTLTFQDKQKLHEYAKATVRYFTSPKANNTEVGFTHAFFGTGKFQVYKNGEWQEEDWDLTRGYGSHVNINEVTLRFLSLAAAYKMGWLDYLPKSERYSKSWGQILTGLQTLRTMQTSGNPDQFAKGHFHRNYLTTITRNGEYDLDRHVEEIVHPEGEDLQSSDDNGLAIMNLFILQGVAKDSEVDIPDREEIVRLCEKVRGAIDLEDFIVNNEIAYNIENGATSAGTWNRKSAEGSIILAAALLTNQITRDRFEQIVSSLRNYPVKWDNPDNSTIEIGQPSYHAAMFIHGLRAIHGLPVTSREFPGLNYFETSTKPVFRAHLEYAKHYGFKALGTQVMTQQLYGTPLFKMNGKQVQFPGNEDNKMPIPNESLSRATGSHAWFIPLQRARALDENVKDKIFNWMEEYEADFFHKGSNTKLGWEAAIPWQPNDKTYAWKSSDGARRYTDWGRPYEALNTAYIVMSIFDAVNPDNPLASYNIKAKELRRIAFYYDNKSWPDN